MNSASERTATHFRRPDKQSKFENVLLEKAEILRSQFRYVRNFYDAVICGLIISGSVCWGGNISKFDRGRLEKIIYKKKNQQVMLWESHWTVLRHSMKKDCTKS